MGINRVGRARAESVGPEGPRQLAGGPSRERPGRSEGCGAQSARDAISSPTPVHDLNLRNAPRRSLASSARASDTHCHSPASRFPARCLGNRECDSHRVDPHTIWFNGFAWLSMNHCMHCPFVYESQNRHDYETCNLPNQEESFALCTGGHNSWVWVRGMWSRVSFGPEKANVCARERWPSAAIPGPVGGRRRGCGGGA